MRDSIIIDPLGLTAADGDEILVGGNTPFLLDGAETVWIVRSGRVELFGVEIQDGHVHGTRQHYLTAEPGDLLFGMDLASYGEGLAFLAVGIVGTRLQKVSLSAVRAAAHNGQGEALAVAVERWVTGLSIGLSRTIVPQPRTDLMLAPEEAGSATSGQAIRAKRGVVWVNHVEGETLLIGMEEIAERNVLFPLTTDTFLQAIGPVHLAAAETRVALSDERSWRGLQSFYAALFRCEFMNTRLARADELNRLREKTAKDRRSRETAVADLLAVLEPQQAGFAEIDADDPLLGAFAVVAGRLGMAVKPPPKPREGQKVADPLGEIARSSRVRMRRVILRGEWWKTETTPFVAWVDEDRSWTQNAKASDLPVGRPVAIMPSRAGRFEVHDPSARTVRPLSKTTLGIVNPIAFTLYRRFPDGLLDAWQVVRFGMQGNTSDLVRPIIVGFIAGLLALLTPLITGRIVEKVIPEAQRTELVQFAFILAAVGLGSAMLDVVRRLGILRLETKMSAAVAPAMWDRLMGLPVSFFRRYSAGDLALRVGGVDRIRQSLSGATMTTMMLGLFSILYMIQLFYYSWQLALLALGLVLLLWIVVAICASIKIRDQRDVVRIEGKISGLVLQLLTGIPKLRVAAAESRAYAQWARAFSAQKKLALKTGFVDATINVFNSAFPLITSICVFSLMWHLTEQAIEDGETPLSIGDFIAFNAALITLLNQNLQMGLAMMTALTVIPTFERSTPILETPQEVDPSKADPGELNGHIEASHVSFRYSPDGPLILNDVSIEIPAGKFIAIVGPSGSGKSTLLRLMLGLEHPESGAVYFDGRDLSQLDVQKLRRKIGVVIQNGKIRQGSIFDNIIGAQPLKLDDAWEAARMAGLEEDVERMAMGMHTVLQQGGGQLSGGQRQRLMIARAIVNRPRVLFLDEATSALDNRTQAIVADSMQRLQATRVAIAHRLSKIIGADRIYVMASGRVVQAGTYQELIGQDGMFADLVKRQIA